MKRTLSLLTVLGAGLALVPPASAQASAAATAPATAAPVPTTAAPAAATPQALDAKIALVNFEQVVLASNEGQVVTASTQKKYEPKKSEIERESQDVDAKNKTLQAATTISDADRATRLREIDTASKKLNRDAEDASTAYNAELTEALQKVAQKVAVTAKTYAQQQGYTILLDVSSQSSNVLWALPSTDISQAIVDSYNKSSGVVAPPPPSPRPATARPAGARPAAPGATKPPGK